MTFAQSVSALRRALAVVCLVAASFTAEVCLGQAGAPPQAGAAAISPTWVRLVEKAAFSPRDTAEGVVFHDKMWLSNGYVAGGRLVRDLWSSSDGVKWDLVTLPEGKTGGKQ